MNSTVDESDETRHHIREWLWLLFGPPFNPLAGFNSKLTLIDIWLTLITLAAGLVGFVAFREHGLGWRILAALLGGWFWRLPLVMLLIAIGAIVSCAGRKRSNSRTHG